MKAVFIYVRPFNSKKNEYEEYREYELGLADATGKLKDVATGMKLTAENYCKMALENDPICCPVIINHPKKELSTQEWEDITKYINEKYLSTARIKEFIYRMQIPFDEPYNIDFND